MNNSPLPKVLLVVLAALSVTSFYYFMKFRSNAAEFRKYQMEAGQVNYQLQLFNAMLNESAEYAKRNPAIEPILKSVNPANAAAAAAAAAAAQTTAKPSSAK